MSKADTPISVLVKSDGSVSIPGPRATRVFYVGVGTMSPNTAKKFVKEFQDGMVGLDSVYYENIFIAVKETFEHKVEVFPRSK